MKGANPGRVFDRSLSEIWRNDAAFQRCRGAAWMPQSCQGCARKEVEGDGGGCRSQALRPEP